MLSNDFWQYISKTEKPIWLYGMGDGADKIINALSLYNKSVYGVFASDDFVRGQKFHGFTVKKYADAVHECGDIIVLVCFGTAQNDVIAQIKHIMSQQEVYAPDVPVYGDGLFNLAFARKNKDSLEKVYSMLADRQSKRVFENTVMYKLTGKLSYLFDCQSDADEVYRFLKLHNREHYVDLGAYRGDTIEQFISHIDGYDHIYAVEPDQKTFDKLKRNTQNLVSVDLFNVCISDHSGLVPFSMKAGRNSTAGKGELMRANSVDGLLCGRKATYIKMDIEGSEALAIEGAKYTITTFKPKMNIACYHRNEDLFDLPLRLSAIRKDYKFFMRHFPCIPSWDTQFYCI